MTAVNPGSAQGPAGLSRRQRVHRATRADLVSAARELLVEQDIAAVTLRAVASRLGMTAPAIYRYYDSREDLIESVCDELYDELADTLEAAVAAAAVPGSTLTDEFLAATRTFRGWALAHRSEFGLMFGAPIPGVGTADVFAAGGDSRGLRFMQVWLSLFLRVPTAGLESWPRPIPDRLRADVAAFVERLGVPVPIDVALLFLNSWQGLYGFVCTEVFGHLAFALADCTDLFEDRLAEFRERLRLP